MEIVSDQSSQRTAFNGSFPRISMETRLGLSWTCDALACFSNLPTLKRGRSTGAGSVTSLFPHYTKYFSIGPTHPAGDASLSHAASLVGRALFCHRLALDTLAACHLHLVHAIILYSIATFLAQIHLPLLTSWTVYSLTNKVDMKNLLLGSGGTRLFVCVVF